MTICGNYVGDPDIEIEDTLKLIDCPRCIRGIKYYKSLKFKK